MSLPCLPRRSRAKAGAKSNGLCQAAPESIKADRGVPIYAERSPSAQQSVDFPAQDWPDCFLEPGFFDANQPNQPQPLELTRNTIMKKTTALTILATAAFTLVACDNKTVDAVKEKADDAKQAVEAKSEAAKEAAGKKIDEATEAAKEAAPAAAAAVDNMAEKAKDATSDAANATKEAADKAVDKVEGAATNAIAPSTSPTP